MVQTTASGGSVREEQVVAIELKKVSRAVIRDTSISSEEREERIFFIPTTTHTIFTRTSLTFLLKWNIFTLLQYLMFVSNFWMDYYQI